MCGRFVFISKVNDILDEFEIDEIKGEFKPSYNIAPGQDVAGIVETDKKLLVKLRWGLIPFWAKDPSIGNRMINARAETLSVKRSFSHAFKKHRCLVVADGFYEWRKEGNVKFPMYFHLRSGNPLGFAGLYDIWRAEDGRKLTSCTIITTEPNRLIRPIHNRMPVIIEKKNRAPWLDSNIQSPADLMPLLVPYNADKMEGYDVSRQMNSPKFNSPLCIKPIDSEPKTLFDSY